MHPIISPDIVPRSAIHISSDIANDIIRIRARTALFLHF